MGRGPVAGAIRYKMSWLGVLKVLLELVFVGLKKDPATHIDANLIDEDKERMIEQAKLNKRLSSADFESAKKKARVNPPKAPAPSVGKSVSKAPGGHDTSG